jgi:hypothetical protein
MLERRAAWRIAVIVMLGCMAGCAAKPPPPPPPPLPSSPPPPPEPQWTWGTVPTKVGLFRNGTEIQVALRTKKGAHARNLLGRGMAQQLAYAFEQSMAFNVLGYPPRQEGARASEPEGESERENSGKNLEETGAAQVEISGTLLEYDLSPASVAGGIKEDPLLRGLQGDLSADSTFQRLSERAEKINEDKIAIELRLMDAQARNEINAIAFHCAPEDWESPLKGRFDDPLRQSMVQPQTPIQRATQACLLKVVNWVGDQYDSWKKNPEKYPDYRKIQEDLKKLGYDCGAVDGRRGRKTEACIQKFLLDKGIGEKDLKNAIAEEVELLSSPY